MVDVGEGFAFVWTSEKSLSFPPILISKIFVCFIMNASSADPQTLVLEVESCAVSEQRCSWSWSCGSHLLLSRSVLELHLRRLILRWVTVYTVIMNKPHVHITPISTVYGAPGDRLDSSDFGRKTFLTLRCDDSNLTRVVANRCSISTWLAMQLYWITNIPALFFQWFVKHENKLI